MKKTLYLLPLLLMGLLLQSCVQEKVDIPEEVTGLAPVYHEGDWKAITSQAPREVEELFKIYYKDNMIFVGEAQKGIHVIDNSNPLQPERIRFIEIVGNSDIAIRGDILYANNLTDLVALDISDINEVKLLSREEGVFPNAGQNLPSNYFGFFECPDPEMGAIIGWSEKTLESPQCWR